MLTNVLGPALPIRASIDALKEPRGRIVLVGSVTGFVPMPGNPYGATKYAVTGLAENTRRQVADWDVGVTPGRVETPFGDAHGSLPPGHLLTADRIADSVVRALDQSEGVDVNTVVGPPRRPAPLGPVMWIALASRGRLGRDAPSATARRSRRKALNGPTASPGPGRPSGAGRVSRR